MSVVFSPDGKMLAAGGREQTVKVWDIGSDTIVHTIPKHSGDINGLAFSPDGK